MNKKIFKSKSFWIIIALVLIVAVFTGKKIADNRQVDVLQTAKVSFSGYNGKGDAGQYIVNVQIAVENALGKKYGLTKSQVSDIEWDDVSELPDNLQEKAKTFNDQKDQVIIAFSRNPSLDDMHTSDLNMKNGETFYMKVKAPKSSPIKTASKKVVISGLKKKQSITESDIKKHLKAKFFGYNGIGYVTFKSHNWFNSTGNFYTVKNNYLLKNGDKIIFSAKKLLSEIDTRTKNYNGPSKITYTVSGLKNPNEIPNLDSIISSMTSYENERAGSSWTVAYKHTYINYDDSSTTVYVNRNYKPAKMRIINTYENTMEDLKSKVAIGVEYQVKDGLISSKDMTLKNTPSNVGSFNEDINSTIITPNDNKSILIK